MASNLDPKELEKFNETFKEEAKEKAEEKHDEDAMTPAVAPEEDLDLTPATEEKVPNGYEKYASNDGNFVRSKLDDGTNVETGNVMESQARAPAHQQHELAVEETAPGAKQAAALMTPRGTRGEVAQ